MGVSTYENMQTNGHSLGGAVGPYYIQWHSATGDRILTSLKIMEVMLEQAKLSGCKGPVFITEAGQCKSKE